MRAELQAPAGPPGPLIPGVRRSVRACFRAHVCDGAPQTRPSAAVDARWKRFCWKELVFGCDLIQEGNAGTSSDVAEIIRN